MFVKKEEDEKEERKAKKDVDIGRMTWYYIQALEKRGLERGTGRARES